MIDALLFLIYSYMDQVMSMVVPPIYNLYIIYL